MEKKKSNFPKFMLLWSGELVSAIGGGLTSFGLGVYVFRQTGSAAGMALVTLLAFLPTLLLSVPAGVLADRYDRRILMMIGDGFSAIGILYILICMLQGEAALYQICIGVTVSSVFSALLEPAYKATVTDLLTQEEYSKASGMVSIAGSARYLVSPVLAGLLLAVGDIKLLLIIDISTFFLTVTSTAVVKRGITSKEAEKKESFGESLRQGWKAVTERKGVFVLIMVSSVMTCFMGGNADSCGADDPGFREQHDAGNCGECLRLRYAGFGTVPRSEGNQKELRQDSLSLPAGGGHWNAGLRHQGKHLPDRRLWLPVLCNASLCEQLSGLSCQNKHTG